MTSEDVFHTLLNERQCQICSHWFKWRHDGGDAPQRLLSDVATQTLRYAWNVRSPSVVGGALVSKATFDTELDDQPICWLCAFGLWEALNGNVGTWIEDQARGSMFARDNKRITLQPGYGYYNLHPPYDFQRSYDLLRTAVHAGISLTIELDDDRADMSIHLIDLLYRHLLAWSHSPVV